MDRTEYKARHFFLVVNHNTIKPKCKKAIKGINKPKKEKTPKKFSFEKLNQINRTVIRTITRLTLINQRKQKDNLTTLTNLLYLL